jgi:methylated-DNA-[protein]-cysteine S-methyltransferase
MSMTERRVEERMVRRAFERLTGRTGEPVRWTMMDDTPVGTLGLADAGRGLVRLSFMKQDDEFVASLVRDFEGRPIIEGHLDAPRRALDRYFARKSLLFDVPFDLSELPAFERRVLLATAKIPAGRVKSYTQVAKAAGNALASRAAGNALHKNPVAIIVPCHRVLRSDGSLGGYGGGLPIKEWLLKHEGALLL